MRVFSPSFSSRLLFATGTCAMLVLAIVLITGGFTVRAGPFRFSAHRSTAPLAIAGLTWLGAALYGRTSLRAAACSAVAFLERYATSGALIVAAAAAAIGVAFGTYSASSADASGYVSHSALLASGRVMRDEPLAREVDWPEATWAFTPLGYRPGLRPGQIVVGYPLGLPLTMVPARLIGGETGAFLVTPFLAALAVLCTYVIGAAVHSRIAGLIASALMTTSPIVLFQVVQPMSDVASAAWWALALACALARGPSAAIASGTAAGLAFLTRPSLLPLAGAVALASAGWPRPQPSTFSTPFLTSRLSLFAAGAVPSLGALALIQWRVYGSPLATGYGDISDFFAPSNIWPNIRDYSWRLLTGETAALALAACALICLVVARRSPPVIGVRRAALLTAVVGGLTLAIYLPYGVFPDWSYLRFLLPALPLAFVVVGALTFNAVARLPEPSRGATLLLVVTIACSFNVVHAAREGAFDLRRYEARYRAAGRYLEAALPADAVIVTSQHSGSASYYTGLPIVRWDQLNVDIDPALAALRAKSRHPVVLIEDWELPAFRARFSRSPVASLDWPARAEFGDTTRVLLLDPLDRDMPRGANLTDRVH